MFIFPAQEFQGAFKFLEMVETNPGPYDLVFKGLISIDDKIRPVPSPDQSGGQASGKRFGPADLKIVK